MGEEIPKNEKSIKNQERDILPSIPINETIEEKINNLIINRVPDAIILIDAEYRINSWNKGAEIIYGWKSSEVLRRVITTVVNFSVLNDSKLDIFQNLQHTKDWSGNVIQKRKNGEICFTSVNIFHTSDEVNKSQQICIIAQDITEKKKIQKKLDESIEEFKKIELSFRRSNERYHALFNSINDMIFVYELRPDMLLNKIEEVNDAVFKTLHYNWAELTKLTPFTLLSDVNNSFQSFSIKLIREKQVTYETTLIDKNHEEIPVELRSQILDLDGKASVISIAREIRERKELEESKRQILQDTMELNRIKSDIILWVFYELKTPLLNTEKLSADLHEKIKNQPNMNQIEILQQFSTLSKNIQNILAQINEFLNLSEDESHLVTLDFEETNLKKFIEETLKIIKNANVKPLQFVLSGDNCKVEFDPSRIQHVFITIISFLLNYTGFSSPIQIEWSQNQTGANSEVTIEIKKKMDDGPEFLLEKHPDKDISLKICQNIVMRHHGRGQYRINSEANELIFELTFPIK